MTPVVDPLHWRQVRALFERCVELPAEHWQRTLLEACPEQPDVRAQVLEMLAADLALAAPEDTAPILTLLRTLPGLTASVPGIATLRRIQGSGSKSD